MANVIRVVSFDLDNTLWHAEPVLLAAEQALQAWLKEACPSVLPLMADNGWLRLRQSVIQETPALGQQVSALRQAVLRKALLLSGVSDSEIESLVAEGFAVFFQARQQVSLFPDVRPVLSSLKQHYHVIAVTNGNACTQHIGIDDLFDVVVNAEEVGRMKPDPLPFSSALQKVGGKAAETVHIGDHPRDDIVAARDFGLRTIWMNWQQKNWDQSRYGAPADAEIQQLSELPTLLQRLVEGK